MAMAADTAFGLGFSGFFSRAERRHATRPEPMPEEIAAICARRDFLNRVMSENAACIEGEHGMMGMMSLYPGDF